jgi:hypothetical protein
MTLTPTWTKEDFKKQKEAPKSDRVKFTIDAQTMKSFLEERLTLEEAVKVKNVEQCFLWNREGLERYRINVWMKKKYDGDLIVEQVYIGKSYFLHYDSTTGEIEDKTIQENSGILKN